MHERKREIKLKLNIQRDTTTYTLNKLNRPNQTPHLKTQDIHVSCIEYTLP
jgi:hypothetical protein